MGMGSFLAPEVAAAAPPDDLRSTVVELQQSVQDLQGTVSKLEAKTTKLKERLTECKELKERLIEYKGQGWRQTMFVVSDFFGHLAQGERRSKKKERRKKKEKEPKQTPNKKLYIYKLPINRTTRPHIIT